ncbi:hypothetical protein [Kineosporia sp. R_H_3]|uniref:hypothetical protein n=1 Tax=Kineosporia sp. R_H_3 TaxID=1961848 RepID=UPI000B4AE363|nr:hypothetical protein [Kineosporia sp. R_H_3]
MAGVDLTNISDVLPYVLPTAGAVGAVVWGFLRRRGREVQRFGARAAESRLVRTAGWAWLMKLHGVAPERVAVFVEDAARKSQGLTARASPEESPPKAPQAPELRVVDGAGVSEGEL